MATMTFTATNGETWTAALVRSGETMATPCSTIARGAVTDRDVVQFVSPVGVAMATYTVGTLRSLGGALLERRRVGRTRKYDHICAGGAYGTIVAWLAEQGV